MTKDQPRLLIKNGTLIDGSGQDPVANMVIVVEGSPSDAAGVLCNTRDEFIRETRKQCKRGVDLIKIADSHRSSRTAALSTAVPKAF